MANEFAYYVKENDELVSTLSEQQLQSPLSDLDKHRERYLYVSKPTYQEMKVEGFVVEMDDIFRFYSLLVGIYVPKSKLSAIDEFIRTRWTNPEFEFALVYDANEGLAEANIPLDYLSDFKTDSSIEDTIAFIEEFLSDLSQHLK